MAKQIPEEDVYYWYVNNSPIGDIVFYAKDILNAKNKFKAIIKNAKKDDKFVDPEKYLFYKLPHKGRVHSDYKMMTKIPEHIHSKKINVLNDPTKLARERQQMKQKPIKNNQKPTQGKLFESLNKQIEEGIAGFAGLQAAGFFDKVYHSGDDEENEKLDWTGTKKPVYCPKCGAKLDQNSNCPKCKSSYKNESIKTFGSLIEEMTKKGLEDKEFKQYIASCKRTGRKALPYFKWKKKNLKEEYNMRPQESYICAKCHEHCTAEHGLQGEGMISNCCGAEVRNPDGTLNEEISNIKKYIIKWELEFIHSKAQGQVTITANSEKEAIQKLKKYLRSKKELNDEFDISTQLKYNILNESINLKRSFENLIKEFAFEDEDETFVKSVLKWEEEIGNQYDPEEWIYQAGKAFPGHTAEEIDAIISDAEEIPWEENDSIPLEELIDETIKELPDGEYRLYSKTKDKKGHHKNLGTYSSKAGAEKRERQVQYFKHK